MSLYPSIYSLSTVGIIKHYTHDYLFHKKRTDFIGPNGVGKSILADLLQMIFVYDKEIIRFGTESIKKEERNIHTLVHNSSVGYCFLNIEMKPRRFLVIGIQLNAVKSRRIIPFVISKSADIHAPLEELLLDKEVLVLARDFLDGNTIPDLERLAVNLHQEKSLKMNIFKNKDDVQDYYKFLFEKDITPLNLSQEKNLRAFAKVIQSFSKAKSLTLSGHQASRSLKDFLFEESDEDIFQNYSREQLELEKILKEYDLLNAMVKTLNAKQTKLRGLLALSATHLKSFEDFKKAELCASANALNILKRQESQGLLLKTKLISDKEKLEGISIRMYGVKDSIWLAYKKADEHLLGFSEYERLVERAEQLAQEIDDFNALVFPVIDQDWISWVKKIDVSIRKLFEFSSAIVFAKPYLKNYATRETILKSRKNQLERVAALKADFTHDREKKLKLNELLSRQGTDTLIHYFVKNKPELSAEALQVVLYFAITPTKEVVDDLSNPRFVDPERLFSMLEYRKTPKGIWISLGALQEFIQHDDQALLLADRQQFEQSLSKIISENTISISLLDRQIKALADIVDGKNYEYDVLEEVFDPLLSEFSNIEKLDDAIGLMLGFNDKLISLGSQRKLGEEALALASKEYGLEIDDPAVIRKSLQESRERWDKRKTKFIKAETNLVQEIKSLGLQLQRTETDLDTVVRNIIDEQKRFSALSEDFYRLFNYNFADLSDSEVDCEELKKISDDAFNAYRNEYLSIVHAFSETSDAKNPAVQLEVNAASFSFRVLEQALLGQIKSTDDIAVVLDQANQERTKIADGIRYSMVKIFSKTTDRFQKYKAQVQRINTFFIGRKISDKFFFKLEFKDHPVFDIEFVSRIAYEARSVATKGELQLGKPITEFIEDFFHKIANFKERISIDKLLDPKTYFEMSARLTDEFDVDVSGSTGESYSAIALLGIARLSAVHKDAPKGLRFIILEELGSLDNTNFNTFPAIAEEFNYQIITMAPHTFNIGLADEWYAHHLIKGRGDGKINYAPSASYFKTKELSSDLSAYLNNVNAE